MLKVTGGICYAHGEYKGPNCPQWPDCAEAPHNPEYVALGERRVNEPIERARLEREVIEASKAYVNQSRLGSMFLTGNALKKLNDAVDTLEDFEAQQK